MQAIQAGLFGGGKLSFLLMASNLFFLCEAGGEAICSQTVRRGQSQGTWNRFLLWVELCPSKGIC